MNNNQYFKKLRQYFIGILAELLIMIIVKFRGYKILARRHKDYYGEIDLITIKKTEVVFIEIKYRSSFDRSPENVVSNYQINRIKNAMRNIMSKFPIQYSCRLDLFVVKSIFSKPVHYINITNS
jgi:putative endonuclease